MTDRQPGVWGFINTINTVSFSSLTNQSLWIMGSLVFTGVAAWLMIQPDRFNDVGVLIASGAGMRNVGFDLAGALLFAWTGKSAITAVSRFGKSKTAVPYVEAKERGKAAVQAEVERARVTAEHAAQPAVQVLHAEKVEAKAPDATVVTPEPEHEWASGDQREGIL